MRKVWVAGLAAVMALALAAVAYGQATQSNTYTVTGSVSPGKSGTSSRPAPVRVRFNYEVGEASNLRPSPVRRYSILFGGLRVNTNAFPRCSTSSINQARSVDDCPEGSVVGNGFIRNKTGSAANLADTSVACNATVTVVNSGNNRATLFIFGNPSASDPRARCTIPLATGIAARFVRSSRGTALQFDVPPNLLHPVPGLDNAVVQVESTIRRITRTRNGRRVGYFETVGGCSNGRRAIRVTFTPEVGTAKSAGTTTRCS